MEIVVLVKILVPLKLFSNPLLKELGTVSLNLILVIPDSLCKCLLCGNENENFTSDMLGDNLQRQLKNG